MKRPSSWKNLPVGKSCQVQWVYPDALTNTNPKLKPTYWRDAMVVTTGGRAVTVETTDKEKVRVTVYDLGALRVEGKETKAKRGRGLR